MTFARFRLSFALIAGILILGLPSLGFLHAAVPHTHTHADQEHAQLQGWLGSVAGRKELSGLFTGIFFVLGFSLSLELLGTLAAIAQFAYFRRTHPDPHESALHRGTYAYRAFR